VRLLSIITLLNFPMKSPTNTSNGIFPSLNPLANNDVSYYQGSH
jgi:hypothetical protein